VKPLYTVNAGEYLVGSHIEKKYRKQKWNIWFPAKDTGIDLLLTDSKNRKAVSLQVKFSKDFTPTHGTPIEKDRLLAAGWWTPDLRKIEKSDADFWIFVLPSFMEKQTSFIILPPKKLVERFTAIFPGIRQGKRVQSYFHVTKTKRCWEARGLSKSANESVALDKFSDENRDSTEFLDAWEQIETKLN
jgi:hypothetical protein